MQDLRGDELIISNPGSFPSPTRVLVLKPEPPPGLTEGSSEHTSWGFTSRVSEPECLEWGPGICISTNFPGGADNVGWGVTVDHELWEFPLKRIHSWGQIPAIHNLFRSLIG